MEDKVLEKKIKPKVKKDKKVHNKKRSKDQQRLKKNHQVGHGFDLWSCLISSSPLKLSVRWVIFTAKLKLISFSFNAYSKP